MTRSAKGDREFAELTKALEETRPVCRDDARYITDPQDLQAWERAEIAAGCDLCPVRPLCEAYARVAKPAGGMWAGLYYEPGKRAHG